MILVQWSCEIPQEKIESFLNFVEEKLKPFYKSYGCKRYELFFPMVIEKKFFPYQIFEKENRYTEQLIFTDIKDFEKFYDSIEKNQTAQEMVGMYVKEFGISACKFKILKQDI
ncbi:MAG: hypothetical protein ACFE8M_05675 [Candidatus Hermodarchaeota archaeon]